MTNLSLTITLRDKLSAIVKKHQPKVLVIGSGDCSKVAVAISRMNVSFGLLGISLSQFAQTVHKPPSAGKSEFDTKNWKFDTEISKSDAEKLISSLNKVLLERPIIPIIPTDTSPKSFGMKRMGINNNKNFRRNR
jgi:hypothetical protein